MREPRSWSQQLLQAALSLLLAAVALYGAVHLLWLALPGLLLLGGCLLSGVVAWQAWQWWRNRW